jgi:peptide/nickel transport system substrate-binding protein
MAAGYEGVILPQKYYQQVGADGFAAKAIGSGPYKRVKGLAGSYILLEAVDKHWAEGVPKYKGLTYKVVPEENTRIAMIQTGEVEIISASRERVPDLQARGFKIFVKERGSVMGCYFHQQWEGHPVGDKRVRQAMNLAINREEIVKCIFAGQAKLMAMYPIGSFAVAAGADPELHPYAYDPAKAKQLLAEAGSPNGFETTLYSYIAGCITITPRCPSPRQAFRSWTTPRRWQNGTSDVPCTTITTAISFGGKKLVMHRNA